MGDKSRLVITITEEKNEPGWKDYVPHFISLTSVIIAAASAWNSSKIAEATNETTKQLAEKDRRLRHIEYIHLATSDAPYTKMAGLYELKKSIEGDDRNKLPELMALLGGIYSKKYLNDLKGEDKIKNESEKALNLIDNTILLQKELSKKPFDKFKVKNLTSYKLYEIYLKTKEKSETIEDNFICDTELTKSNKGKPKHKDVTNNCHFILKADGVTGAKTDYVFKMYQEQNDLDAKNAAVQLGVAFPSYFCDQSPLCY
jgi:hypothetical protein